MSETHRASFNVLVAGHQAFFTEKVLHNIAQTTFYYADALGQPGTIDESYEPEWKLFDSGQDPYELDSAYPDSECGCGGGADRAAAHVTGRVRRHPLQHFDGCEALRTADSTVNNTKHTS